MILIESIHAEEQNRRRLESDSSEHRQHGAKVMIGLQRLDLASFGQNDRSVDNLIELAQVEKVAIVVESAAMLPERRLDQPVWQNVTDEET